MPNLADALASLPHGPEFRFVDKLTALEPGVSATGRYRLRGTEAFLAGHFPSHPIMPAVLLVEAIAQVAGIAAQSDPVAGALKDLRLTAIRSVKVMGAIEPGQTIEISASILGRLGGLIQAQGQVSVDGRTLAEGQITLSGSLPD